MAAGKAQGKSFSVFLVGLTLACAGVASLDTGAGKLAAVVGAVIVAVSFVTFLKLKPLEGRPALKDQPAGLKALGILLTVGGWLIVLAGLHVTQGVGGRMAITLLGILVTLSGVIGVLPVACNKKAIWKA